MQTNTKYVTLLAFIICVGLSAPAVAQWQLTGNRDASATSQIGTTNNFPLKLSTNNLPRMIIDVTGKVGVGTLVPTSALHVAGQVKIVDGTQGAGKVLTSDANGLSSWLLPASSPWTISGTNIFASNTGNVGIGLTTPLYKLDVSGDIRVNGLRMGKGNSSIVDNTAFGIATLDANTTGTGNTAYGYYALNLNTIGLRNTAIGSYALSKDTANENTAIGARALQNNISGKNNTATGANALYANTTGYNNSATGDSAIYANTTGYGNIAVGREALKSNTTGFNNTAIGHQALITNTIGATNTAIGFGADVQAGTYTNATAIGANAKVGASNSMVLGSGANVGIGTATPAARLDVVGTVKFTDGTQALGKVLTSDAAGKASWQIAPGSLWTLSGANAYYSQAGNIGIGTTTPGARLEVNNTIKFTNASSDANDGIIGTAPFAPGFNIVGINTDNSVRNLGLWGSITQYENGNFNSFTGNTYFTNGNVGIGNSQPLERLDVNGNLNFSNAAVPVNIFNYVGGNTPVMNFGVNWQGSNVNQSYRGAAYAIDPRDNQPVHSWYTRPANSGSNNRVMSLWGNGGLSIGSSFTNYTAPAEGAIFQGNVGIGVSNPSDKLEVNGTVSVNGSGWVNVNGGWVSVSGNQGIFFKDWGGGWAMKDNTWIQTHNFKSVTTGSGRLATDGGLTVGYGNDAPPQIKGALIAGNVSIGENYLGTERLRVRKDSIGFAMKIINTGENTYGSAGAYNGLYIQAGESNLHNYQDYFIQMARADGNQIGAIYQNSISSVDYYASSDQRLKTGIKETKYGLETIKNIQVKDYYFKDDTKDLQTGFIAQQLYEQFPHAVKVGGEDAKKDPWMVAYGSLTPVLVKAMQEQQKQIETKDVAIADLQSTVAHLQKQVTALVQKFDALDSKQQACCTAASLVPSKTTATEQTTSLSSASLDQNIPNPPVNHATRIGYNIPKGASKAEMIITDNYGKQLKTINLSVMGKGTLNVDTRGLVPGTYSYTLLVDGKMIDTKQIVVAGN